MFRPRQPLAFAAQFYVATYVVTIPAWYFAHHYKHVIAQNGFCAFANALFIQHFGYAWLTLTYAAHVLSTGDSADVIPTAVVGNAAVKLALNALFTILAEKWFFGPLLIERLNVATGGHCIGLALRMEECRNTEGVKWIDGFDLSGHYFFIITLSMLLLDTLPKVRDITSETPEIRGPKARRVYAVARPLIAFILTVWTLEFCVTSIFFHTVGEKAAGLVAIPISFLVVHGGDHWWPIQES